MIVTRTPATTPYYPGLLFRRALEGFASKPRQLAKISGLKPATHSVLVTRSRTRSQSMAVADAAVADAAAAILSTISNSSRAPKRKRGAYNSRTATAEGRAEGVH